MEGQLEFDIDYNETHCISVVRTNRDILVGIKESWTPEKQGTNKDGHERLSKDIEGLNEVLKDGKEYNAQLFLTTIKNSPEFAMFRTMLGLVNYLKDTGQWKK